MNDIARCSDKLKFIMYADDTNICVSSPKLEDSINCLNGELEKVSNRMASNSPTLNVNKCHCVIFRRRKRQTRVNVNIELNNKSLLQQSSSKFLDERLCFTEHVDHIVKKISKFVPIIYQIRRDMNLYS